MTIPMRLGYVLSPHIVVFLLFSTVVGSDKYRVSTGAPVCTVCIMERMFLDHQGEV